MALADRMIRQLHPLGVCRHPHLQPDAGIQILRRPLQGGGAFAVAAQGRPKTGLELFLQIGVFRQLQAKVCLRLLPACQVQPHRGGGVLRRHVQRLLGQILQRQEVYPSLQGIAVVVRLPQRLAVI